MIEMSSSGAYGGGGGRVKVDLVSLSAGLALKG